MADDHSHQSEESGDSYQVALPISHDHDYHDDFLGRKGKSYEIDHVGNGSFQVSQLNLLSKRSKEASKSVDYLLSARGLHHRSKDVFVKEVHNATNIIKGVMRGEKFRSTKYKPSGQLFQPHFQRAIAYERTNEIEKAIADYTVCININDRHAISYFNRAGLYRIKKIYLQALQDINSAILLEPANIDYRINRAMIAREMGEYEIAVKDTIVSRALEKQPELAITLEHGGDISHSLENDLMYATKLADDPILAALATPPNDRLDTELLPIKDFLKTLKLFANFHDHSEVLSNIAQQVEMNVYEKGNAIFSEGEIGDHFYMILDGEVSIIKIKPIYEDIVETTVLVKLFRGQTFGETALESRGGLRTAGAIASQTTRLLSLHAEEYQSILSRFRSSLKEEVRIILASSALFADWETNRLDYLASFVIIKNFGANKEIMKAQEKVPCLMLIKSGIVTLVKSIPKPPNHVAGALRKATVTAGGGGTGAGNTASSSNNNSNTMMLVDEDYTEIPGLWVLNKTWTTRLDDATKRLAGEHAEYAEFTVGVLGSGQVFGELAVLDASQPSPVAAISSTAVELYCFESDVLLAMGARFTASTMKALMESLTLHDPPADKIAYYYRQKYNWEVRKHKLMNRLKNY